MVIYVMLLILALATLVDTVLVIYCVRELRSKSRNSEEEAPQQKDAPEQDARPVPVPLPVEVPQESLKLLVVDDDPLVRQTISDALKDEYEVSLATNGAEGLRMTSEIMPDIIISDVVMPEMDGLEFIISEGMATTMNGTDTALIIGGDITVTKIQIKLD